MMASIMCRQKLWRALSHTGRRAVEVDEPLVAGTRLGNWAATVGRFARRDLVLALNERTYLTLVFPLVPRAAFRSNFATALGQALEDHRVPKDLALRECAEIEVARVGRLGDRTLRAALDTVEFMCHIELSYHDDLRRVQMNLNEFPHPNRDPCVPTEAVVLLFAPVERTPGFPGRGTRRPVGGGVRCARPH
jgi:hypothetical protein